MNKELPSRMLKKNVSSASKMLKMKVGDLLDQIAMHSGTVDMLSFQEQVNKLKWPFLEYEVHGVEHSNMGEFSGLTNTLPRIEVNKHREVVEVIVS